MTDHSKTFKVPDHRLAAMKHLQVLVSTGYRYWNTGTVAVEKAENLVNKFARLYSGILATPNENATRKRKGIALIRLVILPAEAVQGQLRWFLVATAGKPVVGTSREDEKYPDLIHTREKMKNITRDHLPWGSHYVLGVRTIQRPKNTKRGPTRTCTWSISPTEMVHWRNRVKFAAQAGAEPLEQVFDRLRLAPMFGGVRADIRALDEIALIAWKKRFRNRDYPAPLLNGLPYTRAIPIFAKERTVASVVCEMLSRGGDVGG